MKKWMKIIIALFIVGIVGAGLGYKFVYNKPHRNYEKAKPDYSLSAAEVFEQYTSYREKAEEKYNGKVLQISGIVTAVETPQSLTVVVFALQEGMFGDEGIRCTLLPGFEKPAEQLTPGKSATIKGYCTGYNETDIILEKCSIINK